MGSRNYSQDDGRVYVGNLVHNTNTNELDSLFSKFGKITNIWIARNPPGFAFVTFDDPRDARDALEELNGINFKGNSLRVERVRDRRRSYRDRDTNHRPTPRTFRRSRSRSHGRRYRSKSPSYRRFS